MINVRTAVMLAILALGFVPAVSLAQESEDSSPGLSITFSPPEPVTIRRNDGGASTGRLLSLSDAGIEFENLQGKQFTYGFDSIRTVKFQNGNITYNPKTEPLSKIIPRLRTKFGGAVTGSLEVGPGSMAVHNQAIPQGTQLTENPRIVGSEGSDSESAPSENSPPPIPMGTPLPGTVVTPVTPAPAAPPVTSTVSAAAGASVGSVSVTPTLAAQTVTNWVDPGSVGVMPQTSLSFGDYFVCALGLAVIGLVVFQCYR